MGDRYGSSGTRWQTVRARCYMRDMRIGARCWICGGVIDYAAPPGTPDAWEPDHYIPASDLIKSGHPELVYDPHNLRPAHMSCNRSRGKSSGRGRSDIGEPSRDWDV